MCVRVIAELIVTDTLLVLCFGAGWGQLSALFLDDV